MQWVGWRLYFILDSWFFSFFGFAACRILVPWPGIEPLSPALEVQSLNHWTAREIPEGIWYRVSGRCWGESGRVLWYLSQVMWVQCLVRGQEMLVIVIRGLLHSANIFWRLIAILASLMAQQVKNLPANAGDVGSIPGLGRSPGEGNGNPLQYSSLENSMDRGNWQATVPGVVKSWA